MIRRFFASCALLMLGSGSVGGAAAPGWELELLAGRGTPLSTDVTSGPFDTRLRLESSRWLGLAGRYRVTPQWAFGIELATDRADLDAFAALPVKGAIAFDTVTLNGEYRISRERGQPFLGVGLGLGRTRSDARVATLTLDEDGTFWVAHLAAGMRYPLTERFALSGQLRYRFTGAAELRLANRLDLSLDGDRWLVLVGANLMF